MNPDIQNPEQRLDPAYADALRQAVRQRSFVVFDACHIDPRNTTAPTTTLWLSFPGGHGGTRSQTILTLSQSRIRCRVLRDALLKTIRKHTPEVIGRRESTHHLETFGPRGCLTTASTVTRTIN
jgi:hypothetical protein